MDITHLPFNHFIGIETCEGNTEGIFQLSADQKYLNHVGTVHASALYALAEASSGEFLSRNLRIEIESIFPILRRADIKEKSGKRGHSLNLALSFFNHFVASLYSPLNTRLA